VPEDKKLAPTRLDVWAPTISSEPTPHRPRVNTPLQDNILAEQARKWLVQGVIEPIPRNAYFNNLVFVAKKNGATRVCVDCTPVNMVTEDYDWPLPRLQDLRHATRGARWFARLDLKDAFFRILVPASLRLYTSFRSGGNQYQFRRMPFGLKTAPATFQRFMDTHLAPLGVNYFWFIDDILIHAETLSELRTRVACVKKKIRAMGCTVNEEKSEYDSQRINFVGMHLSAGGLGPDGSKVREILATPPPTTKKEAQSALGLVSYLRDFIPLVSHFTSILYPDKSGLRLTKDDYCIAWRKLLGHLASATTSLRHWNESEDGDLYADASGTGLGLILVQNKQVVALASRQLTPAETRYSATDREHLALVFAADKFRFFLHRKKAVTRVWSDHKALLTRKVEKLTPRQARWREITQYWIPNLVHVKGIDNPADFVSRWSVEIHGGAMKT
jgi:hypothetical protein